VDEGEDPRVEQVGEQTAQRARGLDLRPDEGLERLAHVRVRGVALLRIARHRAEDDLVEAAGDLRAELARRHRGLGQDPRQDLAQVLAVVGRAAGQERVQRRADRVEIAAQVDLPSAHLLGRGVQRRSEEDPRARELHVLLERARQPEIADLDAALRGREAVRGLDVAVDDAGLVRGLEPVEDLDRPAHGLRDRHGLAARDPVLERLAGAQLHRDRGRALDHVRAEDEHAGGVGDGRRDPGLAAEALESLLGQRELLHEHLERDVAAGGELLGLVDDAHPAAAELPQQPEAADLARERGVSHRLRGRIHEFRA
jgi:hypothetical protein